ncbi:heme-thiolate peroxidase [Gelatoporia subvermispora B]|uniref:Heme-thiolate peroxidase n=1 Tax=Ceriporiopsis subvermispora (strain B) TaxID=914234 RepID=M2PKR8_CERS8|nr:heme-thiolate peroxidase [Gelatoporia subvermispora B]
MYDSFAVIALRRISLGLLDALYNVVLNAGVMIWDVGLTLINVVLPSRPAGRVVPAGAKGAGGVWPAYEAPAPSDSRCSCPALNALANHGILPHSGRDITFRELNAAVRASYNFAPSFCFFVPNYIAGVLGRSYWTGKFDLSDIDVHNGIEHDASLARVDSFHSNDQGKVCATLVQDLLSSGTGAGGNLTTHDLSRALGRRRTHARNNNPQYSCSLFHKLFGSSNSATLLRIFGGSTKDLQPILLEERLPDGWQPSERHQMGLTLTAFQPTVLSIELGIKEEVDGSLSGQGTEKAKVQ